MSDILDILNQRNGLEVEPESTLIESQPRADVDDVLRTLNGDDWADSQAMAELNPPSYNPPSLHNPEMLSRSKRSGVHMTVGFGSSARNADIEDTLFPRLPMPFRSAIVGVERARTAIASPIMRLFGRGDLADEVRRQTEAFSAYNQELSKNSILGETVGPVVNSVGESLATGTMAAPAGGLAATSMAFGLDGADRTYVESRDSGQSDEVASYAAARQFFIDGIVTYGSGKLLQSKGLNPGRYFGDPVGKAARKAAQHSGLNRVLYSGLADGGIEALQGAMTYGNEVYTGLREFDWKELGGNMLMSAAAGGLAGTVTAGADVFSLATQRFEAKAQRLVNTVKRANEFNAKADTNAKAKAVEATTNKEFADATGVKGLTTDERIAFQEEIVELETMRAQLEQNGVDPGQSIAMDQQIVADMEAKLQQQTTEMIEAERAINDPELSASEQAKRRTAMDAVKEQVKQQELDLKVVRDRLARRTKAADGEIAESRAFLESELNRLVAESDKANPVGRPTNEALQKQKRESRVPEGTEPTITSDSKARSVLGKTKQNPGELQQLQQQLMDEMGVLSSRFDQRFKDIETSREAVTQLADRVEAGETIPMDYRRDLAKLVDQFGSTQNVRADIYGEMASADSPESFAASIRKIADEIDKAELKTAKSDFQDAIKKSRNVRPEQADQIADIANTIDNASAADIRDAADEVRSLTYESEIADRFLTYNTEQRISGVSSHIVGEVSEARPLAMKADSPVRKVIGGPIAGLNITRDYVSLDSPLLRELASRPEVQMLRLSDTLAKNVYERIGVDAQSDFDLYTKETVDGISGVLNDMGLDHAPTLDNTMKSSALEKWRNESRKFKHKFGELEVTRDEVQGIMLLARDPENLSVLKKAGFNFPDGRTTGPLTEKLANQFRDFLGPQGDMLTSWQFQYLNGPTIDRVNDAMRMVTGRPVTRRRNTVPRTAANKDWDITGASPTKGLREAALTNYSHLRKREGTSRPLTWPEGTTGGIDYFMNHVDRMNRIAAFTAPARDVEMILNRPDVEASILAKDGREGLDSIKEAVRITVNGAKHSSMSDSAIRRFNGAATLSVVGARLSTMLTQGMSTIASSAYDTRGLRDYLKNAPAVFSQENRNLMEQVLGDNSGHFWRRYKYHDYLGQQSGGVVRSRGWFRPPEVGTHFVRPLATIERSINSAWRFAKARSDAAAEGLVEGTQEWQRAVARKWELATYRGENTANGMELSGFLRMGKDNPAIGVVTTLQNTASKIYSLLPRAFDLADQGRYKEAIGVMAVAGAAIAPVSILRMAMRDREDDVSFEEAVLDQGLQDLVSLHSMSSFTFTPLVRAMQGMSRYGSKPLLMQTVEDIFVNTGELAGGLMDAGESADSLEDHFNRMWDVIVPLVSLKGIPMRSLEDYQKRLQNGTLFPGVKDDTDYTSSNLIDTFSATMAADNDVTTVTGE